MTTFSDLLPAVQRSIQDSFYELRKKGVGYKKFRKLIREKYFITLSNGTLGYWKNHSIQKVGRQNRFDPTPSAELAYILGCLEGDASFSINLKNQDYRVDLQATDQDFVEKFSCGMAKLLNKKKPFSVNQKKTVIKGRTYTVFVTHARCKELCN